MFLYCCYYHISYFDVVKNYCYTPDEGTFIVPKAWDNVFNKINSKSKLIKSSHMLPTITVEKDEPNK